MSNVNSKALIIINNICSIADLVTANLHQAYINRYQDLAIAALVKEASILPRQML